MRGSTLLLVFESKSPLKLFGGIPVGASNAGGSELDLASEGPTLAAVVSAGTAVAVTAGGKGIAAAVYGPAAFAPGGRAGGPRGCEVTETFVGV